MSGTEPAPAASPGPPVLKWLSLVAGAGGGAVIPGGAYFLDYAPPHFPASALLVSSAALGIVLCVPGRKTGGRTRLAPWLLIASVVLFVGYESCLGQFSVLPPPGRPEEARFAAGLGVASWSLTDQANEVLEARPESMSPGGEGADLDTATFLMLALDGYAQGPSKVWRWWSINLAGGLLILVFGSSFLIWALAWALIARASSSGGRLVSRLNAIAGQGKSASILYDSRDGKGPRERVVKPLGLVEGTDGVLLRALQESPSPVIRHFRLEQIVHVAPVADSAGPASAPPERQARIETPSVVLPRPRHRDGKDWFSRHLGVLREVVSDLEVEDWEVERVKAERKKLGIGIGQERAVHAYLLAEYLLAYAEDGVIDEEEHENLGKLWRCLAKL